LKRRRKGRKRTTSVERGAKRVYLAKLAATSVALSGEKRLALLTSGLNTEILKLIAFALDDMAISMMIIAKQKG